MRRLAATLAVLALVALAGCGGGDGSGTQRGTRLPPAGGGGTLTWALPSLPGTLDPLAAQGRIAQTVTRQVYEPLIGAAHRPLRAERRAARAGSERTSVAQSDAPGRSTCGWAFASRTGRRSTPRRCSPTPVAGRATRGGGRSFRTCSPSMRRARTRFASCSTSRCGTCRGASPPRGSGSSPLGRSSRRAVRGPVSCRTRAAPVRVPFEPERAARRGSSWLRFAGWWGSPIGLGPALDGVTFVVAPLAGQRYRMLSEGTVQVADPLDAAGLRAAEADPLLRHRRRTAERNRDGGLGPGDLLSPAVPALTGVWLTRLTG